MRAIKFRAWDSKSNKMYFGDDVIAYGDDTFVVLNDKGEPSTGHAYLMQFIGLLDKNGKEIYEGDIVTCEIYERENLDESNSGKLIKVEWSNEATGFYPFNKGSQWRSGCENIEVHGNIYEHKHLLTE